MTHILARANLIIGIKRYNLNIEALCLMPINDDGDYLWVFWI